MNISLSNEEIQILLQCIQQLNFSGQHVRQVGLLVDKLTKSLEKLEDKKKTE